VKIRDASLARNALLLLAIVFFGEAGFFALSMLAEAVMSGEVPLTFWRMLQVLELGIDVLVLISAVQMKRALDAPVLPVAFIGVAAVEVLLGAVFAIAELVPQLPTPGRLLTFAAAVVGIALMALALLFIAKIGRKTVGAAVASGFVVVRGIGILLFTTRLFQGPVWIQSARSALALLTSIGIGLLALQARGVVAQAVTVNGPALPEAPVGAGRLILTGGVLLALGIGVTVASYSVASSSSGGGRYVVATGAIASGLVQLVRGLGRLGKSA
jgi:hypothetical protein